MARDSLQELELRLLLEGIYQHYGYDFREYARSSVRRRVWRHMTEEGLGSISALQDQVLHDREAMERLLLDLSVSVTSLFRDPSFFRALREKVVPILRTYPFVRIWNAGCSSGEETLSLSILMEEAGLGGRVRIYATDMNRELLERSRLGQFPLERMQEYTANYISSGGARVFSDYYRIVGGVAQFSETLLDPIVFAQHNLVTDSDFNEFHLIICRNVMIYFDKSLQNKVMDLLYRSLTRSGVLALGQKESLRLSSRAGEFEALDLDEKIYRRVH